MLSNLIKLLPLIVLLNVFSLSPSNAAELPSEMEYQNTKLILNGHGTRIRFFMKAYEGSLYLTSTSNNAEKIINDDAPMSIRMDVISSLVTPDAMKIALNEGLEKSTGNNTNPITKEINQLNSSLNIEVKAGDFFEFIYLPDSGTHVLKNSKPIDVISGIEFKKAFFGIFLSNNPIQKNMKKAMLGG